MDIGIFSLIMMVYSVSFYRMILVKDHVFELYSHYIDGEQWMWWCLVITPVLNTISAICSIFDYGFKIKK